MVQQFVLLQQLAIEKPLKWVNWTWLNSGNTTVIFYLWYVMMLLQQYKLLDQILPFSDIFEQKSCMTLSSHFLVSRTRIKLKNYETALPKKVFATFERYKLMLSRSKSQLIVIMILIFNFVIRNNLFFLCKVKCIYQDALWLKNLAAVRLSGPCYTSW